MDSPYRAWDKRQAVEMPWFPCTKRLKQAPSVRKVMAIIFCDHIVLYQKRCTKRLYRHSRVFIFRELYYKVHWQTLKKSQQSLILRIWFFVMAMPYPTLLLLLLSFLSVTKWGNQGTSTLQPISGPQQLISSPSSWFESWSAEGIRTLPEGWNKYIQTSWEFFEKKST